MTSSSSNEEPAASGRETTLARARRLSLQGWLDVAVAIVELAIARLQLDRKKAEALLRETTPPTKPRSGADGMDWVDRVRIAISRASHRVPWRADCLVQALAARRWLRRHGVATELSLGVPSAGRGGFEAHAWLVHQGRVVTGGDVAEYVPLKAPVDAEPAD